jgi:hypothetical protein
MKTVASISLALICVLCLHPSLLPARSAATTRPDLHTILTTKSFTVTITDNRPDGEVTSDDVMYYGVSKRTGKSIRLKGADWHTTGPDGSPGRFLGYKFKSGNITYLVFEEGRLEVLSGNGDVLVDEAGTWNN